MNFIFPVSFLHDPLTARGEWAGPRQPSPEPGQRLGRYEELLREGQQRVPESVEIYIPPGPRLGDVVIEAECLTKGFDDRLLIEDLSFREITERIGTDARAARGLYARALRELQRALTGGKSLT